MLLKSVKFKQKLKFLSRPDGGINALTTDTSVHYATIDDAVRMINDDSYLAKIDLQSAYRSVPIHPSCFNLTGIQWTFEGELEPTYMFDCRLPFGASRSCRIFQAICNAISRAMSRENYKCVNYIDDFWLCQTQSWLARKLLIF